MDSYLQYVHNLKGSTRFERLKPADQAAIVSRYILGFKDLNTLEKALEKESDHDVLRFISEYLDLNLYCRNIIFTTNTSSYVDEGGFANIRAIINLRQINSIQYPHKLLRAINTLLPYNGIYIGRLETYAERKNKIYDQMGKRLGRFLWLMDFGLHRVIPRIRFLDDLYFHLTKGEFHAISLAETLGRLVYCGFDIVALKRINKLSYFVAQKKHELVESWYPSYYPIIKLRRIGKDEKVFGVYRARTMHPYSEYLQDYVVRLNEYNDKGKPGQDFRLTRWGMFFRKYWIDEFPQIVNVLKGEMKLVGLRPLSRVRFNEFPEDLRTERLKHKPGCIPPYVALNMPDDKMNIESERIYIRDLKKHPFLTDIRYFFKAVYNIITNKIRGS